MKPILRYPGAKHRLAPWICSFIPEHDVYLEPFAGSLAVLFAKNRSHIETINDIDGEIVNFFRILRSNAAALSEAIWLTPFSREEYYAAYNETDNPVEQARRFAVKCWMGFGCGNRYCNGFKTGQQKKSPNPAKAWNNLPETIMLAAERLKGVQIECMPAVELIKRYNTPDVFIYADPPYLPDTRKKCLYKHEMDKKEHEKLLAVLACHPGKIMISGYDNRLYNEMLTGWNRVSKNTQADGGRIRIETLWMNYSIESGQTAQPE